MLWTIVKIMHVQKLETQYNAKYTLHKEEEASSKGHPSNKNDDVVTSGVVPSTWKTCITQVRKRQPPKATLVTRIVMSMMSGVMLQWQTIEWVLHEQVGDIKWQELMAKKSKTMCQKHRHKKARHKQQNKWKERNHIKQQEQMVKTQELCDKSIDMKGWQVRAQVARIK